jgi:hypothetical protein
VTGEPLRISLSTVVLSVYSLKWNPFAPDVPVEGLWKSPALTTYCQRLEYLSQEGGFACLAEALLQQMQALRRTLHRYCSLIAMQELWDRVRPPPSPPDSQPF